MEEFENSGQYMSCNIKKKNQVVNNNISEL